MKKGTSAQLNENYKEKTFSSGVTARILPFPAGLFEKIGSKVLEDYPEPLPPKKVISVLGGTEEVDDLENPEYKQKAEEAKRLRDNETARLIGEATLDFCLVIDLDAYEDTIKRLEKYGDKFPTNPDERRIRFLTEYVMRSKGDYESASWWAIELMSVSDKEVAERISSFQNNVARSKPADNGTSGANEVERVEMVKPV